MKKLIFGAMSLGLLLTACSSESILDQGVEVNKDVDHTYFIKVNIHGDSDAFTRAAEDNNGNPTLDGGDFVNGTDAESAVNTVYFVFYDKNGNVVGNLVQANDLTFVEGDPNSNTVEQYGTTIVQVDVPKTSEEPAQVICYINPTVPQSLQFDLATIQTILRDNIRTSAYGFAMSNSVYYPATSGQPGVSTEPQIAVPINADALKKTYAEAADNKVTAMDIYVERYAARLSFTYDNSVQEAYETSSPTINSEGISEGSVPVTLTFKEAKWALNAEAKQTYMIKSFRKESASGQLLADNYTFGGLNKVITSNLSLNGSTIEYDGKEEWTTGQWTWNSPTYHRSYWAMSPAYFTSDYPEVASDVDTDDLQVYYSYDDLNKSGSTLGYAVSAEGTTGYFKETTVGSIALTSKNPKAAVASVILTGQYSVNVNGEDYGNVTFYTYNKSTAGQDLVFFETRTGTTDGTSAIDGTQSMLSRLAAATSVLYVLNSDGSYSLASRALVCQHASIDKYKPATTSEAEGGDDEEDNVKVASRLRTLVLNDGTTTANSGLYVNTPTGFKSIVNTVTDPETQISLADANENIYQQVGTCAMYKDGMAYFNIPVMHYGWYRSDNPNKARVAADGLSGIEWSDVRVGDFGIVRNHAYSVSVSELTGLGTGIANEEDPIVPPADTESYYVKYRVNILKWAVVPTQSVKL